MTASHRSRRPRVQRPIHGLAVLTLSEQIWEGVVGWRADRVWRAAGLIAAPSPERHRIEEAHNNIGRHGETPGEDEHLISRPTFGTVPLRLG
jgi:hypothetical protein